MSKKYDKEFKENIVRYYYEHTDLNIKRCATNLLTFPILHIL